MGAAFPAFLSAFLACVVIVLHRHRLACTLDTVGTGPQKFHTGDVPRIGGVAILIGVVVPALFFRGTDALVWALIASTPAFLGGLVEDMTKRFSPEDRLWSAFIAATAAFLLLDARVTNLDLPGDALLAFPIVSFLFTIFAVGGFAHALNIVDGFNGLAGMVALLMLIGIGIVAAQVGDSEVLTATAAVAGAVLGFLVWNYPRGLIFAGDAGAYVLGFLIAVLVLLLQHRNSEISAWFPLVILLYPVTETCFSIYRKKVLRGQSPAQPDGLHLHMLVYKRWVRTYAHSPSPSWRANSLTSPYLVCLAALAIFPAVLFWANTTLLQISSAGFIAIYIWLYWQIVRFKTPRFLIRLTRGNRWGLALTDRADDETQLANISRGP